MKGDGEGKMNTVEKQCVVHVCSRPAIVGSSQSVTFLSRNLLCCLHKPLPSLYTSRLLATHFWIADRHVSLCQGETQFFTGRSGEHAHRGCGTSRSQRAHQEC